jgi:hypothetical protein
MTAARSIIVTAEAAVARATLNRIVRGAGAALKPIQLLVGFLACIEVIGITSWMLCSPDEALWATFDLVPDTTSTSVARVFLLLVLATAAVFAGRSARAIQEWWWWQALTIPTVRRAVTEAKLVMQAFLSGASIMAGARVIFVTVMDWNLDWTAGELAALLVTGSVMIWAGAGWFVNRWLEGRSVRA